MDLQVTRDQFSPTSTQGLLDVNGVFACYTMEPRKDQSQGKPFAIPPGRYRVQLLWSNHFGRITPHLEDVPGFTDIEIHPGNFPRDTEACTLVGIDRYRNPDVLGRSREAFDDLMAKLNRQNEPIWISYIEINPPTQGDQTL